MQGLKLICKHWEVHPRTQRGVRREAAEAFMKADFVLGQLSLGWQVSGEAKEQPKCLWFPLAIYKSSLYYMQITKVNEMEKLRNQMLRN